MNTETGKKAEDVRREKLWSIKRTKDNFETKGMCRMKPRGWIRQISEHSAPHPLDDVHICVCLWITPAIVETLRV